MQRKINDLIEKVESYKDEVLKIEKQAASLQK
jgi:hypothetical protein